MFQVTIKRRLGALLDGGWDLAALQVPSDMPAVKLKDSWGPKLVNEWLKWMNWRIHNPNIPKSCAGISTSWNLSLKCYRKWGFPWVDHVLLTLCNHPILVGTCSPRLCDWTIFWRRIPSWLVVWNMNGWFFQRKTIGKWWFNQQQWRFIEFWNNHPNWRTHILQRARYTTS